MLSIKYAAALATALALAGCAQTPKEKPPEPPAVTRVGTVGHVGQVRDRGLTPDNWKDYFGGLYNNQIDRNIIRTRWEVTVLYDDHTQGNVLVDADPGLQPGQRIQVTGTKIEPTKR